MRSTRLLLFTICCLLALLAVSGCTTGGKSGKYLRYSVGAEPETLDPRKSTGSPDGTVEAQLFEGLTTLDANGRPAPGVAESWEVSADGKIYVFHLRSNAKWSNGDPVTAQDFEYAWKTTLSPELGSKYAYQLYYLVNGEAYNKQQVAADQVGVSALDNHTLRVVLAQPTAYFAALTAFHTLYPVNRTAASNEKWATDPKTLVSNGPFKLLSWTHNSKIELGRNEYYWDAASVRMSRIDFILTESAATELAMFENGQLEMGENPPRTEVDRLAREGKLSYRPYLATYFYCFNVTQPPFDNRKVRRAFSLAINRQAIIQSIIKGGAKPAMAWVPPGLTDVKPGSDFRLAGGDYFSDADIETARRLLAEAGYPDGRDLPPITLIYNTSENHKAIAEAVQEMWKKNLGVSVSIANQEWKVFLNTRQKGDYQISRHGWIGDYPDPMTFLDMFETGGGNNDAQYSNPAFDRLVRQAKNELDVNRRMQLMHEAERLLMEDAVIAPIYFYTHPVLVKPNVKGWIQTVLGSTYLKGAYLE